MQPRSKIFYFQAAYFKHTYKSHAINKLSRDVLSLDITRNANVCKPQFSPYTILYQDISLHEHVNIISTVCFRGKKLSIVYWDRGINSKPNIRTAIDQRYHKIKFSFLLHHDLSKLRLQLKKIFLTFFKQIFAAYRRFNIRLLAYTRQKIIVIVVIMIIKRHGQRMYGV